VSGELIGTLRALHHKRITLDELRRCWLELHPEQLQHPERDALLLAELEKLARAGALALPARASYERRGNPCMPKFVTLANDAPKPAPENWESIAWVPELGFWTTLVRSELQTARAINTWLLHRRGRFRRVPLRERSLEIFGDEKYLDVRVRANALFGGQLPLSAIGAFIVPHPLPYRAIPAPEGPLLVVENHHTYWSLAEWNLTTRRYAAVVYGSGQALGKEAAALEEVMRECAANGALYFGDLDPRGILIPLQFNSTSRLSLQPAVDLYRMALEMGVRRIGVTRMPGDETHASQWIAACAADLTALWNSGRWIPQESIGTEQLFADPATHPSAGAQTLSHELSAG
jgi:hypothetical protein